MDESVRLDEAVPLVHAVADHIAVDAGVRLLAIKGPVAALQGLRGPRQSVDVDVLVDPARQRDFAEALEARDWKHSGFEDTPGVMPRHATVFRHPAWPCEIDVHYWYPGMLTEPQHSFDVLWRRRVAVALAHRPVATTDPVATAAVTALTALRAAQGGYHGFDLNDLAARLAESWSAAQREELSKLAAAIGASETLRPFLDRIDAPRVAATAPTVVDIADWRLATGGTQEVLPWLVGLTREPWRRRPAFVWRGLWLADDRFKEWDPEHVVTRRDVLKARVVRARRALRALPRAWADYRRLRGDGS